MLTQQDIETLKQIIDNHITSFAIEIVGADTLEIPNEKIQELVNNGIITQEVGERLKIDYISDSYRTGMIVQKLEESGVKTASDYSKQRLMSYLIKNPIPLTKQELKMIDFAKTRLGNHITGLGNTITNNVIGFALQYDKDLEQRNLTVVRDTVKQGIEKRKTIKNIVSDLGHKTQDWSRDWERIASTEIHEANQLGMVESIIESDGIDANVAVIPEPDACKYCKNAYLKGGKPRIFKLVVLLNNGTNVGKKANEWLPVKPPMHPYCKCRIIHIPKGFKLDDNYEMIKQ